MSNFNRDEVTQYRERIEDLTRQLDEMKRYKRRSEEKLRDYEDKAEKAEKASKMKSLFLANMSHEIRTPLNAIEGFSRIMAETESYEERQKYLDIIESNNARLLSLIDEILDLSRVEAGEVSIKKSRISLNELCKSLKQIFQFRCPAGVEMAWIEPKTPLMLDTDQNRVTQVFSNLISNAIKHTTRGSIRYGYELCENELEVEFYVADTGTGIDPKDLEIIFKTYTSKDADTNNNGFGLGLPLSKIIVEKLGGRITVESTPGVGSTFRFYLPFSGAIVSADNTVQITTTQRTIRNTQRSADGYKPLVLVAEDEDWNYGLIFKLLQKRFNVIRAKDGIEAVTLNDQEQPDLVLMDIKMPNMQGTDATRIIKEVNPEVPVIAVSAYAFPEAVNEAMEAGCDAFMAKPFKVDELYDLLDKFLKN